jgi:hypothetical protein
VQNPLSLSPNESVQAKPKRMMTVDLSGPKAVVHINFSSLEILNACHRKAYYFFRRDLRGEVAGPALTFGSAIHKALECWYRLPRGRRAAGNEDSLVAFRAAGHAMADDADKRSLANGEKILRAYFKQYADDPFELYSDEQGPFVEREFSFPLYDDQTIEVHYNGVIDCVMRNPDTDGLFVCDHKTTSALGSQFFDRIRPNHQYTGYLLGAKKCFGLDTDTFMVNGIQVAKTKQEFARQFTDRNASDYKDFTDAVVEAAQRWVQAIRDDRFVQNAPTACTNYGQCPYLKLCAVPEVIRENIIKVTWPKEGSC